MRYSEEDISTFRSFPPEARVASTRDALSCLLSTSYYSTRKLHLGSIRGKCLFHKVDHDLETRLTTVVGGMFLAKLHVMESAKPR